MDSVWLSFSIYMMHFTKTKKQKNKKKKKTLVSKKLCNSENSVIFVKNVIFYQNNVSPLKIFSLPLQVVK